MYKNTILVLLLLALSLGGLFPRTMHAHPSSVNIFSAPAIEGLSPDVYQLALKAHLLAVRKNEIDNPDLLTIIDYSKPSYEKRLWVIKISNRKVLHHTYVAHGVGSGHQVPVDFSNVPGSKKSSLGVFKTGDIYPGKHGHSLNLHGLEETFNSNAYARRVVIHGSKYVGEAHAKQKQVGRSHGCPALASHEAGKIIQDIKNGSMLFIYYPDKNWLNKSRYV